jgi:hypothetical protein
MTRQRGKSSSKITYARMSNMQMRPFLSMVHCGRRRYERRVKSIKDINEDDDVEDVEDDTDDVVEENQ